MATKLLSGNEAYAFGAYLAGVKVASAYPGTPSTEILQNLRNYEGVYCEWAPNEKVAMEVAVGAAFAGARSLVTLKHVGLNVAADPLLTATYTGIKGGLVIVNADDPGMHSSQNEQDNRNYAKFAKIAMLEPANSQEAVDFMRYAYDISEEFDTPVIVRTVTRISHSKTPVEMDVAKQDVKITGFEKNVPKYVMLPAHARGRHPLVEERVVKLGEFAETFPGNKAEMGDKSLGIITSGVAYQMAREIFPNASILKLGMVYPLPAKMIKDFAGEVNRLIVLEELDPFLEENITVMGVKVEGKSIFPLLGEFTPNVVRDCAIKAGLLSEGSEPVEPVKLPIRPPALCPGCGHRGVFHVFNKLKLQIHGDIGCYGLGALPPLQAMDTSLCMGASIGLAHGAAKAGEQKVVAVIGDSTFYHNGIAPLMNAIYNKSTMCTVIVDNETTGMTGHQDHPGTGLTLMGEAAPKVDMVALIKSLGVENISVLSPYDLDGLKETLKKNLESGETSVIIAKHPCVLKSKERHTPLQVNKEKCTDCGSCLKVGCPPLYQADGNVQVDTLLCTGCGLCAQVCPFDAFEKIDEGGAA